MRLSAIAACTLATLAAGDLNQAEPSSPSPSAADRGSIEHDTDREVTASPASIVAIASPETVLDLLSGFATAPASAIEPPQPQFANAGTKKPLIQQQPGMSPTASGQESTAVNRSVQPSSDSIPNFLKLTSAQVVKLQQQLKAQGFDPGEIDGILGPQTQRAIVNFQRQSQLQADGLLGPKTWSSLVGSPQPTAANSMAAKSKDKKMAVSATILADSNDNETMGQPLAANPEQPVSTAASPLPPSHRSFNVRLAAGFITGFSIPLVMVLLWQMIQTLRSPEDDDPIDNSTTYQGHGLIEPSQGLPAEDQSNLENHCRAIAEILARNAMDETISQVEDPDKAVRVQFVRGR